MSDTILIRIADALERIADALEASAAEPTRYHGFLEGERVVCEIPGSPSLGSDRLMGRVTAPPHDGSRHVHVLIDYNASTLSVLDPPRPSYWKPEHVRRTDA